MGTDHAPGPGVRLELEPWSLTAVVDGERFELSIERFQLLAYLAARPRRMITSRQLIDAVFPEVAQYLTIPELNHKIYHLRLKINEKDRTDKILLNRRRGGYFIGLDPEQIRFVEPPSLSTAQPTVLIEDLKEASEDELVPVADLIEPVSETPSIPARTSSKRLALGLATAMVLLASAALALTNLPAPATADIDDAPSSPPAVASKEDPIERERVPRRVSVKGRRLTREGKRRRVVVAAPVQVAQPASGSHQSSDGAAQKARQGPSLPPPPSRLLYHLVNPQTGEHFVTTDAGTASDYKARGFTGGAIGRVYDRKVTGTRAITTNAGPAYVFSSSKPKTDPASVALPLWLVRDSKGDFFYTTNEAETTQDGWTSTLVGYVRTP